MNNCVLRTINLSKKYQDDFVLNNVNLTIKKGDIYGFIGQNGAGKTTLIRIATGLAFPTNGDVELFGDGSEMGLINSRKRIGTIIEGPALFPNMTAQQNLEIHRIQKGIPGKGCIKKTLDLVGLSDTGRKKVKDFSLGMKQRLGLAMALIGDPEFLILDEPINGLDPTGIIEIRELLKRLNREKGITILISSHILGELYHLANCYGIIHNGKLIEQLTLKELDKKCKKHLRIKVDDVSKAATIIETQLGTSQFEVMPDSIIKLYEYLDDLGRVSSVLAANGLIIEEFMPMGDDLESYFTRLIGGVSNE
ncbi:ATP-binding cassette domain-containing protein [Bacillus paramycoides]|uniref:ATP-binding cassette domain-containing protein n=1 Tax=Bacillus paramycoides TaxID=2026194 RepID=UPI003D021A7F